MSVVLSPASECDLEEIGDYIAQDNPSRAVSFIMEMRKRCLELDAMPEAAPLREDVMPGIRMAVHGNFLIFYRIDDQEVRIERILHGARNIQALFS
jgi:toxin ParE1/3/4